MSSGNSLFLKKQSLENKQYVTEARDSGDKWEIRRRAWWVCLETPGLAWGEKMLDCLYNSHLTSYNIRALQSRVESPHNLIYSQWGAFNHFVPTCAHALGHRNPTKTLLHYFLVSSRNFFRPCIPHPFLAFFSPPTLLSSPWVGLHLDSSLCTGLTTDSDSLTGLGGDTTHQPGCVIQDPGPKFVWDMKL